MANTYNRLSRSIIELLHDGDKTYALYAQGSGGISEPGMNKGLKQIGGMNVYREGIGDDS